MEVRKNLTDFGIPQDLQYLKTKSKLGFKNLVKKKAREFEFKRLLNIKSSKSKLRSIQYSEFKMQKYLELKTMTASKAKILFKFRVRMAPFGENFRGGATSTICPLCMLHPDTQSESFHCVELKRLIKHM